MKNILRVSTIVITLFSIKNSSAQTAAIDNKPSKSISYHSIPPSGPTVFGIFEGRPPCQLIAKQVDSPMSEACDKVK